MFCAIIIASSIPWSSASMVFSGPEGDLEYEARGGNVEKMAVLMDLLV